MIKKQFKVFIFSVFTIYSLFFIIGSTFAPIMAHLHKYDLSARLTTLYMFSCHQQPDRSFWIFNYPIALCCRCYGFYIGTAITSLLSLLINEIKINIKIIIIMFLIVIFDLAVNYFNKNYNTGNFVRLTVGLIMGTLFILIVNQIVKIRREKI